ncbi:hypothetical protein QYE76_019522 [Lolium multiflorum]|uniref:Uncharacterized protein n=1 Tax=Lolium multiflorum TaxID=4521 RepID=A0AAD8R4N4_LOLMU|nr:hypothetical protein QYE76_019522 [Lolium multiflorum]
MVLYMLSFFLLPKGILHKLDYYRSRFFWQGDSEKKKYRLVKWSIVCSPKDQGGLGVHDVEGSSSPKTILSSVIGKEVSDVFFVIMMKLLNTSSSSASLRDLFGLSSK